LYRFIKTLMSQWAAASQLSSVTGHSSSRDKALRMQPIILRLQPSKRSLLVPKRLRDHSFSAEWEMTQHLVFNTIRWHINLATWTSTQQLKVFVGWAREKVLNQTSNQLRSGHGNCLIWIWTRYKALRLTKWITACQTVMRWKSRRMNRSYLWLNLL
jgi:hypothetical protein